MGRFIYKPGVISEDNKDFLEIWKDSGPLELYRDADNRVMTFDDFKIPINRTYYLECDGKKVYDTIVKLFTPTPLGAPGNYGDMVAVHERYNYLEDRILGKYLYDYNTGKFLWDDTEHSITPLEDDMYKFRDSLIFFISRLDYITSVINFNIEHIKSLRREYNKAVDGGLRDATEDDYSTTHKTIRNIALDADKIDLMVSDMNALMSNRLANLDKYLDKDAEISYSKDPGDSQPYRQLIISPNPIGSPTHIGNRVRYKYDNCLYLRRTMTIPKMYHITLPNNDVEIGDLTYVLSDSSMFEKTNGGEWKAIKNGTCQMFAVAEKYNHMKSNIINIYIGDDIDE